MAKKPTTKKKRTAKSGTKPVSHKRNGEEVTAKDVKPQISANKLKELLSKARTTQNDVRSMSGQLGQAIAKAVEDNHLHRKAFNIVKLLDRMRDDPEKLADTLDALEFYLDASGLQVIADKVLRLNFDGQGGEGDEDEDEDEKDEAPDDEKVVQMRQQAAE